MTGEPGPRYFVRLTSEATYGPDGGTGPAVMGGLRGLRLEINVPNPPDAPRALRAVADQLELNHLTLEAP